MWFYNTESCEALNKPEQHRLTPTSLQRRISVALLYMCRVGNGQCQAGSFNHQRSPHRSDMLRPPRSPSSVNMSTKWWDSSVAQRFAFISRPAIWLQKQGAIANRTVWSHRRIAINLSKSTSERDAGRSGL